MKFEPLRTPNQLKQELPLSLEGKEFIDQSRETVRKILQREDPRLLLVVGPCSIHSPEAAIEYGKKLKALSEEISDIFFPVMRVYVEKPRTSTGWTGILNDPYLDGTYDLNKGLEISRQLLLHFTSLELPTATEFLSPSTPLYIGDLITWGSIGARTSSSQVHRQLASGIDIPIGFKNCTAGRIDIAVNAVVSAQQSHRYIGTDGDGLTSVVQTVGNPNGHIVLRGGYYPNYDQDSIQWALKLLHDARLSPYMMVDCAHDNSGKEIVKQLKVFQSIIESFARRQTPIMGLMLESNLHGGTQKETPSRCSANPYVSYTDPCIDWETTKEEILRAHDLLKPHYPTPQIESEDLYEKIYVKKSSRS